MTMHLPTSEVLATYRSSGSLARDAAAGAPQDEPPPIMPARRIHRAAERGITWHRHPIARLARFIGIELNPTLPWTRDRLLGLASDIAWRIADG